MSITSTPPIVSFNFPTPPLPLGMVGILLVCHGIGTAVFQNMPLYPTFTTLFVFTPLVIGGVLLLCGYYERMETFFTEEKEPPIHLQEHPHAAQAIATALFATALFFRPSLVYLGLAGRVIVYHIPQLLLLYSSISLAYTLSKPAFETSLR